MSKDCVWTFDECREAYEISSLWAQLAPCGWTTFEDFSSYNTTLYAQIIDQLPNGKNRTTQQVFAVSVVVPSNIDTNVQTVSFPGANNTVANMSITGLTYSAPSLEYPFTHISLSFSLSAPFPWKYSFKDLMVPTDYDAYLPGPYESKGTVCISKLS